MYASVTNLITLHTVPASLCEFWQTSANLPAAFHIKEDWLFECVAKAKSVKRVSREENADHSRVCGRIILKDIT